MPRPRAQLTRKVGAERVHGSPGLHRQVLLGLNAQLDQLDALALPHDGLAHAVHELPVQTVSCEVKRATGRAQLAQTPLLPCERR